MSKLLLLALSLSVNIGLGQNPSYGTGEIRYRHDVSTPFTLQSVRLQKSFDPVNKRGFSPIDFITTVLAIRPSSVTTETLFVAVQISPFTANPPRCRSPPYTRV